jgi:hypothetical protein
MGTVRVFVSSTDRIAARYVLCFMFFLGMTVTFLLRVNINLAIVGMVKSTSTELTCGGDQHNTSQACLHDNSSISTNEKVLVSM